MERERDTHTHTDRERCTDSGGGVVCTNSIRGVHIILC